MKKGASKSSTNKDNSFGVASVVLGILSIALASAIGIILGIVALVFANKQQKLSANKWGKNGKVLSIIGIILSILALALTFYALQNPGLIPT